MSEELHHLPRNRTSFETAMSLASDPKPRVDNGLISMRTIKLLNPPQEWVPFLIYEYGLGELRPYISNLTQLINEGIDWQRKRGTDGAIGLSLSWLGYTHTLEEFPTKRRYWNRFMLDLAGHDEAVYEIDGDGRISGSRAVGKNAVYETQFLTEDDGREAFLLIFSEPQDFTEIALNITSNETPDFSPEIIHFRDENGSSVYEFDQNAPTDGTEVDSGQTIIASQIYIKPPVNSYFTVDIDIEELAGEFQPLIVEEPDLKNIDGVANLSTPLRSDFWRGFREYDVRALEFSRTKWGQTLFSTFSGVRVDGYGEAKWSFGRCYENSHSFTQNELVALGVWTVSSTENILPVMTGQTTDGVTITSSSLYGGGFNPWKLSDGIIDDQENIWASENLQQSAWVEFAFDEPRDVLGYSVRSRAKSGTSSQNPKEWTFEVWDDDASDWVVVDERFDEDNWTAGEKREYSLPGVYNASRFRINIVSNNGHTYVSINEMELQGRGSLSWGEFTWEDADTTWSDPSDIGRRQVIVSNLISRPLWFEFRDGYGDIIGYRRAKFSRSVEISASGVYTFGENKYAEATPGIEVLAQCLTGFGDGDGKQAHSWGLVYDAAPIDLKKPGLLWVEPGEMGEVSDPVAVCNDHLIEFGKTTRERVSVLLSIPS